MGSEAAGTAVILGVNGQDGSYLAEVLLSRGVAVTGVGRQDSPRWVTDPRMTYVALDLRDAEALDALLARTRPGRIFHLAAIHGAAGSAYETGWRDALAVNVGSQHACLEHLRQRDPGARLFYASSLKAFGEPPPALIDEATPRRSTCLYGITKNAATDLLHYYRRQHGAWAAVGYFFNHESPRRPDGYFMPRLVNWLLGQSGRMAPAPPVASLDFWCDWGSALEYMELVVDLMNAAVPSDAVFATGQPVHAADLAGALAEDLGLPRPIQMRSHAAPVVRARLDGLQAAVGRLPRSGALDVARWILAERQARPAREASP